MATLEALPTEIMEQIALNLIYPNSVEGGDLIQPKAMGIFRLTSRTIDSKVYRTWLRLRCSSRTVNFSDAGFEELADLAGHAKWSEALQTLCIKRAEPGMHHYEFYGERAGEGNKNNSGPNAMGQKEIGKEYLKRCTKLETGGSGTGILADSLRKLPNLHTLKLESRCYNGATQPRRDPPSSTVFFMAVMRGVTSSGIRLRALDMLGLEGGTDIAMAFKDFLLESPDHMESFVLLESIALVCTRGKESDTRDSLSPFFRTMPALKKVRICLETALPTGRPFAQMVLGNFARLTHPDSTLEELHISGAYISLYEQDHFLTGHADTLKSLTLSDCNLEGTEHQWRKLLQHLATFPKLQHVELKQLVENDMRVCFPSTAHVDEFDIRPQDLEMWHHSGRVKDPESWVYIRITDRYRFVAGQWEDVQARLREAAEDVEVSEQPAMTPGIFGRWFG